MHRFDEQFLLKEANRKMQVNEERAAVEHALGELRHSRLSARQRLAHALVEWAIRLEPGSYPVRRERVEEPKC